VVLNAAAKYKIESTKNTIKSPEIMVFAINEIVIKKAKVNR
jgi:hypothetical protein